jgi:hypothetical protein
MGHRSMPGQEARINHQQERIQAAAKKYRSDKKIQIVLMPETKK